MALRVAGQLPEYRRSEFETYRRCGWRWQKIYEEGWVPKRKVNALWFGIGVHEALAEYYKYQGTTRGPHPAETFQRWAKDERRYMRYHDESDEQKFLDLSELGVVMLQGYVQRWGSEPWLHVIAREQTSRIKIPNPRTGKPILVSIAAFDLLFRDMRLHTPVIRLMEHKTAKAIITGHLVMDDQAGTYDLHATQALVAQGLAKPDERVEDTVYNFLRKGMPDDRPKNPQGLALNKDGSISKIQPKPLFHRELVPRSDAQRRNMVQRLANQAWVIEQTRKGKLPIIKNSTKDCSWDCPLRDICELDEKGQDWEDLAHLTLMRGDPYEDHYRKSTEGEEEAA